MFVVTSTFWVRPACVVLVCPNFEPGTIPISFFSSFFFDNVSCWFVPLFFLLWVGPVLFFCVTRAVQPFETLSRVSENFCL